MVFAINPKDKFSQFKNKARNANATTTTPIGSNSSTIPSFPINTGGVASLSMKLSSLALGLAVAVVFAV